MIDPTQFPLPVLPMPFAEPPDLSKVQWDHDTARRKEHQQTKLEEQLDMLWHDIDNGLLGEQAKTGTWYTHIKAVKDKYPKGEFYKPYAQPEQSE